MRYVNAIITFFAFFIISSCSFKSDAYKQLVVVDSLLLGHNHVDSAVQILENVDPITAEDTAYYNILKTAASYRSESPVKTFYAINNSINYYIENYDARMLAYAYYYKTTIFIDADSVAVEIIPLLKKAEQHAEKTTDYRLMDRIYSVLTYANGRLGEFDEALKYAYKELAYAQKLNDNYYKAYALVNLAITHHYLSQNSDSSEYYIQQCKAFADEVEDKDKLYIHNYMGLLFLQNEPSIAKQYFVEALKYDKLTETYLNLAKVYYADNQYDIAQKYCDSALIAPNCYSHKETYMLMAEYFYKCNDIERYKKATEEIMTTQSIISEEKENRKILELQKKFDYEKQQAEYDRNKLLLISIISLMVVLIGTLVLSHQLRIQKIRSRDLALENLNAQLYSDLMTMTANEESYKKQIAELESENLNLSTQKNDLAKTIASNKTRITILQSKVDKLNTQKYEYVEMGKNIYQRIEQNQAITMYDDRWANCVYYFTMNIDGSIFDEYNKLTINDKVFIIADTFLSKNDDEIAGILAISPVTVRSRRSKIKRKKIVD